MCVKSEGSPPLLSSQTTLILLNVQIVPKITAGIMTGLIMGRVMFQNCCHRDAPSTWEASYISFGMACNPPKATTIMKGNPSQIFVMIHAENASTGWLNHCMGDILKKLFNIKLMDPYSWLNIPRQVRAAIYCGSAQGIIRRVRNILFAGRVLLIRTAKNTPRDIWKLTLITVQIIVFPKRE